MPEHLRRENLPEHFLEGEKYYEELRKDRQWLKAHMGKYLAIKGREIIDMDDDFEALDVRIRQEHQGPLFMPHVTRRCPEVATLSPYARPIRRRRT